MIRLLTIVIHNYGTATNPSPTLPLVRPITSPFSGSSTLEWGTQYHSMELFWNHRLGMGTLINTQTLSQPTSPSVSMMSSRGSMLGLSPTKRLVLMVAQSSAYTVDMIFRGPSEMPKEPTGTSWSLTTIALTPDACGVDCEPSQTIKWEIAVMPSLSPLSPMSSHFLCTVWGEQHHSYSVGVRPKLPSVFPVVFVWLHDKHSYHDDEEISPGVLNGKSRF